MSIPLPSTDPDFIECTILARENPFNFIDAGWLNTQPVMGRPAYSMVAHQAVVTMLQDGTYETIFRFTVLPDRTE